MSVKFAKTCQELKLVKEKITVKKPNMNVNKKASHSIF